MSSINIKKTIVIGLVSYFILGVFVSGKVWVRELGQFVCHDRLVVIWAHIREPNPNPASCARRGLTTASLIKIPYNLFVWPSVVPLREDPRNKVYKQGVTPFSYYIVDGGAVYREEIMQVWDSGQTAVRVNDTFIKDADPRTFITVPVPDGVNADADKDQNVKMFLANDWGKDSHNIFWESQKITPTDLNAQIDLATFIPLSNGFIKDKNYVYELSPNYGYRVLPNADPSTFILLSMSYAKDKNGVYSLDELLYNHKFIPIPNMEPSTFNILGICAGVEKSVAYYTADSDTVMVGSQIVPSADAKTFRLISTYEKNPDGMSALGSYAVDKNHVYRDCGIVVPNVKPSVCTEKTLKQCDGGVIK